MKTLSTKSAEPKKGGARVGGDSKTVRDRSGFNRSEMDNIEVDSDQVGDKQIGKKAPKKSKSKNLSKFKKMVGSNFFISKARLAFTKLRQVVIKALIL